MNKGYDGADSTIKEAGRVDSILEKKELSDEETFAREECSQLIKGKSCLT